MYIGNHLSASKGYAAMGRMAVKLGANTFAFFTRNPRGGAAKAIDPADVEKLLELMREQQFGKLVAHAPYTMNLCAAKEDIRKFSKEMIADDLRRMEYTPGNYYNFHPGSHVGQGADAGIEWIAEALNEVLTPEQTTTVLLETMAGKGSEVGRSFEELRAIIDRVELSDKLGICLDTCHVFAAGYDIVNECKRRDIDAIGVDVEEMDITDAKKVDEVIKSGNYDAVIHCAAWTAVDKAEENYDLADRINGNGPTNLAKAAKKVGAKLVHISTDYVFGGDLDLSLIHISEPTRPY